jgi:ABC-type sulfate transport system permease component
MRKIVSIVMATLSDVPLTFPHLVSSVIIIYVIEKTGLLQPK